MLLTVVANTRYAWAVLHDAEEADCEPYIMKSLEAANGICDTLSTELKSCSGNYNTFTVAGAPSAPWDSIVATDTPLSIGDSLR